MIEVKKNNTNMKVALQTVKKIVLEVPNSELDIRGFDAVWDEIRLKYPESLYDLFTVENLEGDVMFFELTPTTPT